MFLLFCFQVLLFFIISIQVNSLQTVKQYRSQNLDIVKDVKFSSNSGNPYILACNSNTQCQDTVLDDCVMDSPDQNTWYCNCFCDGYGACYTNQDCCSNNCINEVCTHSGGEQGTVCSAACSTCAANYECQLLPGDEGVGFCDYLTTTTNETTIHSMSRTTKNILSSTATKAGNPYIYTGCPNGNSDCQGDLTGVCAELDPNNPDTWVCQMACRGVACNINVDCVNNECINGICSSSGGSEGTFCYVEDYSDCANCTQGFTCYSVYENFGYCGYS